MRSSDLSKSDYNNYYAPYLEILGDKELMDLLGSQLINFPQFIKSIPNDKLHYSYAEGKWTVAEVLLHVIDTERVFQYRALRFARNDDTPLPGFDQDLFVKASNASNWNKEQLINTYEAVRQSTISLFSSFGSIELKKSGIASNSSMSVAALGFICCGHQKHHRNIIRANYL